MGPDVDGLIGHLEAAEDAVQRRAAGVAVPGFDAILLVYLQKCTPANTRVRQRVLSSNAETSVKL